jgi:hypothetical protein
MKLLNFYMQVFYSACGKPSKYLSRNDQVLNAYTLLSMIQGVNLFSALFLIIILFPDLNLLKMSSSSIMNRVILFSTFCIPLVINYFSLLRKGKKTLIKEVNLLIEQGRLKPKSFVIWYVIGSIITMALCSVFYSLRH